eukprot:COSAG02_NODE_1168_length_14134_cov_19.590310_2_plen_35_part_00
MPVDKIDSALCNHLDALPPFVEFQFRLLNTMSSS